MTRGRTGKNILERAKNMGPASKPCLLSTSFRLEVDSDFEEVGPPWLEWRAKAKTKITKRAVDCLQSLILAFQGT